MKEKKKEWHKLKYNNLASEKVVLFIIIKWNGNSAGKLNERG